MVCLSCPSFRDNRNRSSLEAHLLANKLKLLGKELTVLCDLDGPGGGPEHLHIVL